MTVLDIYKPHSQRERACVGVCDEPKTTKHMDWDKQEIEMQMLG